MLDKFQLTRGFVFLVLSLVLTFNCAVAAPEHPRDTANSPEAAMPPEFPQYSRDITKWREVAVPPKSPIRPRMVWSYAASYSDITWRVFIKKGRAMASDDPKPQSKASAQPKFVAKAAKFVGGSAFAAVADGWLVGFNEGEFGAALYWFSRDGKRNYKISDDQVVAFVSLTDGIYAVQGLAHMSLSEGSIVRISRPSANTNWTSTTVVELPAAPYTVSLLRDKTMLITLSSSLVSVGPDHKVRTLLADAPWRGLYPNSSVLSPDEKELYIGMRQFVGEFDLTTHKLRLLIPADEFLNKLSKEDEAIISRQYGS